ncbi:hypothetical protein STENM327S_08030 [Streptomyces tendae]
MGPWVPGGRRPRPAPGPPGPGGSAELCGEGGAQVGGPDAAGRWRPGCPARRGWRPRRTCPAGVRTRVLGVGGAWAAVRLIASPRQLRGGGLGGRSGAAPLRPGLPASAGTRVGACGPASSPAKRFSRPRTARPGTTGRPPHRVLEVEAQFAQRAGKPLLVGTGDQPGQVQDERRGEGRVAALPRRLKDHAGAEEPVEGDVVPGGLPVAERGHVVDVDLALDGGAEGVGEDAFLAGVLRRGGRRVGEGGAVAPAQEVGAGPGAHRQRPLGEHRAQYRAQQGLPGLAVAAGVGQGARFGGCGQRRVVQPGRRGEVDVRAAGAQGGGRVQRAGGKGVPGGRGFGGGHVHDHGPVHARASCEVGDVRGERGDQRLLVTGVAGQRAAGADLAVGRGQFGAHGRGQSVRQHAPRGQGLRPLGQGAVHGVVTAEDKGREGGQSGAGEVGGLGDHAGRGVQPRGHGGAARHHRGGDGAAGPDQPDTGTGAAGGSRGGRGHGQPPCRARRTHTSGGAAGGCSVRGDGGRRSGVLRPPPFGSPPQGRVRPRRAVP